MEQYTQLYICQHIFLGDTVSSYSNIYLAILNVILSQLCNCIWRINKVGCWHCSTTLDMISHGVTAMQRSPPHPFLMHMWWSVITEQLLFCFVVLCYGFSCLFWFFFNVAITFFQHRSLLLMLCKGFQFTPTFFFHVLLILLCCTQHFLLQCKSSWIVTITVFSSRGSPKLWCYK